MEHPIIASNSAKIYQQERLQEAVVAGRYRQIKGNQPSWLQSVGDWLIAAGQKIKAQAQANTATPAFHAK